jgi:hypothetical protein
MVSGGSAPSLLLALPDNCLLAVLQRCAADDQRSLFSAARAHSRLHQATLGALQIIDAPLCKQRQADRLLLFLAKYAEHIDILDVSKAVKAHPNTRIILRQLPRSLQLRSLYLHKVEVRPGHAFRGVLGAACAADLQLLSLSDCCLPDWGTAKAIAAALGRLPALQSLSIRDLSVECCDSDSEADDDDGEFELSTAVFSQLQQLTFLHLAGVGCGGPGLDEGPDLQPLQALTRLSILNLSGWDATDSSITASMLSDMQHLTRFDLSDPPYECVVEPGVLAGKTRLQHLSLQGLHWGADAVSELLSRLQHLQDLTHLDLEDSMEVFERDTGPPAAAFSALTASSKLQYLSISSCRLPEGIWPHMFPSGRLLPHLQTLVINDVEPPSGDWGTPPDGSLLVSCCPGLRDLHMEQLNYTAELLAPLQGLSELHSLWLAHGDDEGERTWEGLWEAVGQVTGLRQLSLDFPYAEGLLLQLTQLKQLTALACCCLMDGARRAKEVNLKSVVSYWFALHFRQHVCGSCCIYFCHTFSCAQRAQ